jgi:hypothetical protein
MTYGVGNPDFGLEQAQTCGRVKHCLCIFQHNMILFTVDKKNYCTKQSLTHLYFQLPVILYTNIDI